MNARLLLLCLALLTACGSPQQAIENQDYDKGFKLSLAALNRGDDDQQLPGILQESLEQILEREAPLSRRLAESDSPDSWKEALEINSGLQEKVGEARVFLPGAFEKETRALPAQASWLRERLYTYHFDEGLSQLALADSTGIKEYAQYAHGDFTKAQQYAGASSPRLDSLTLSAYKKGIVYYRVDIDAFFNDYRWEAEQAFEELEGISGGFLRIAVDEPMEHADCAIEIRLDELEFEIEEEKGDQDYNKEVVLEYKTVTDTSGREEKVPVYGTVEGNVIIITKTKAATLEADVSITRATANCGLSDEDFEASISSEIREVRISGDERAIPEEYLNAPIEVFMEEDDMAEKLLEDLYEQVVRAYF